MAVVAATVVDSISSATATVVATYSSGSYCLAASVAEATDSAASIPIIRMGECYTPPFLLQKISVLLLHKHRDLTIMQ